MNIEDIINYYVNLLIIQYNQLPNARATIAIFIQQLLANGVLFDIRDGYNLETAVGVQLDVLAKYIGVDRFFTAQSLDGYFGLLGYTDTDETYTSLIGFSKYSDFEEKPGNWLIYNDIASTTYSLPDAEFRILLKLKILQNNCNHSDKEINDGIFEIFGISLLMQDNFDMTMTYIVDPSISTIINIANEKGILPKPMGVGLTIESGVGLVYDENGSPVVDSNGFYVFIG